MNKIYNLSVTELLNFFCIHVENGFFFVGNYLDKSYDDNFRCGIYDGDSFKMSIFDSEGKNCVLFLLSCVLFCKKHGCPFKSTSLAMTPAYDMLLH